MVFYIFLKGLGYTLKSGSINRIQAKALALELAQGLS